MNQYQYRGFPYAPFETINQFLLENLDDDGIVVHSNKLTMLPAYYYNHDLPHTFIADQPGTGSDTLAIPTQEVIGIMEEADICSAVEGHIQVFFIIFDRELLEYEQSGAAIHPNLQYLRVNYKEQSVTPFGDVWVYEFLDTGNDV
jgi:hypothetical protein